MKRFEQTHEQTKETIKAILIMINEYIRTVFAHTKQTAAIVINTRHGHQSRLNEHLSAVVKSDI